MDLGHPDTRRGASCRLPITRARRHTGSVSVPQAGSRMPRASGWSGLVALLLGVGQQAHAQELPVAFGECQETMFISQGEATGNTPIHTIDTTTNPFTFVPFIALPGLFRHNAIGYNPSDNFLYSIEVTPGSQSEQLLRFGNSSTGVMGTGVRAGTIAGLPAGDYNSGTFDDNGLYYVRQHTPNSQIHVVDVSVPQRTHVITMSQSIHSADMAFFDGMLYTIATGTHQLYRINPNGGAVTAIGSPKGTGLDAFGAMFVAANGLFAAINTGGFYQVNTTTGTLTRISDSPPSSNNDGAKCQNVPIMFGADLSVTKTSTPDDGVYIPGQGHTYTIVVTNHGPFGAAGVTVHDPLPDGITDATWTCTGTNGGVCTASGTGAINDAHVGLPVDATVTYLLTLTVPEEFTGALRNTVTVDPGPTTIDPNPDNNTDTDLTYSVPVADLWVTKTNTPESGPDDQSDDSVLTGTRTTYTIVFGNNGPVSVENALLFDIPEPGLDDCALGPTACGVASGTATCPEVGEESGQLSMSNLASASVAVPLMQAGSSIRVHITCTVQ